MELKLYDDNGKKLDSYTTPDSNVLIIHNDADLERPEPVLKPACAICTSTTSTS